MKRGPHPKPSVLRLLDGSAKRLPPNEPIPIGTLPDAPPTLDADEARLWRETLASVPAGLLRRLDLGVYMIYVRALVLYDKAYREVVKSGGVVVTKGGSVIQNPWLGMMNRQAEIMLRAAGEMGFSPSARTRLSVTPPGSATGATPSGKPNAFARNGVRRTT